MTEISTIWQRHPTLFAVGLSAPTVGGFALMLGDAALWKGVGFVFSALPSLFAAFGYLKHRHQRKNS